MSTPSLEDASEANGNTSKSHRSPLLSRTREYFSEELTTTWSDIMLILNCFVTGLLDSAVFNTWSCFVSMQTGTFPQFSSLPLYITYINSISSPLAPSHPTHPKYPIPQPRTSQNPRSQASTPSPANSQKATPSTPASASPPNPPRSPGAGSSPPPRSPSSCSGATSTRG